MNEFIVKSAPRNFKSRSVASSYGRPFVSKLWHDIRAVFPTYTCNHSCYTIYVRFFFATYTCVRSCFVAGADPGFFLEGGALVSCSTSTPINHIVFFLQNTSCIRKPQVISGGGVRTPCTLPLDPPLCGVFIPKYMTIFLQTRIYMRTKKSIYMRYKQACGIWGHRKS